MNRAKIFWWSLLLFAFIIPLSSYVGVRLLLAVCIFSFFAGPVRQQFNRIVRYSWPVLLYLLVLMIGLCYSADVSAGWKVIETSLSLFMLSVAFAGIDSFDKSSFYRMLLSFVVGVTATCVICLVHAAFLFYQTESSDVFFFYALTDIVNLQPTYFAYYLCFSIGFLLYLLYYGRIRIPVWTCLFHLSFLFVMLMLTGGRTAYISLLLAFSFFILKYLFEDKKQSQQTKVFAFSIFLLVVMLLVNHFDLNTGREMSEGNSDSWERLQLWQSALQANPNIFAGVGTGDYKSVLNSYYLSHHLVKFANDELNAHNVFIQILLSNGIGGLISVLLLLGRPIYLSAKYHQALGVLIFFPFFIYGTTEAFLGRYQGVVFFAFLYNAFMTFYYSQPPAEAASKV